MPVKIAHAAGCYGSSCNFQDPATMGCASDAVDTLDFEVRQYSDADANYIIRTEQRYSRACGAAWTRTTLLTNIPEAGEYPLTISNITAEILDPNNPDHDCWADYGKPPVQGVIYTSMLDVTNHPKLEAIGTFSDTEDSNPSTGQQYHQF